MLGQIMNLAVEEGIVREEDFMTLSEAEIIKKIDDEMSGSQQFRSLYRTFRDMTSVVHAQGKLAGHFCINLKVKLRYINPLVMQADGSVRRIREVSPQAAKIIQDFLTWEDTPYGCVKLM